MVSIFDRMSNVGESLSHAWNAFVGSPDRQVARTGFGAFATTSINPSRNVKTNSSDRSIIASIYNRIGIDAAAISINHVYLDENKRYLKDANSGLTNCLTLTANIDQGASAFRQDIFMTLFDKGVIAIVPIDTSDVPLPSGSYDIYTMRVGEIINWYPRHVRVRVYNDLRGIREEITLSKNLVAIVENPLYSVMNETNSTLQRLLRKLNLLDSIDDAAGSGKLDLIIQLPYVIKNDTRREQADERARDIEAQLKGSKYGIAYTDGSEKITQLNRPVENNMLAQIQYLTTMLYSQLGLTASVFDGTADEKTMLNYYNRTIEPMLRAVSESMKTTFLTKTARTQGQSIEFYRDPFKLLAIADLAEIADKLTRNEILSSNEFRSLIGFKPAEDPNADKLLNKNLPVQAMPAGSAPPQQPATIDLGNVPSTVSNPNQLALPPAASPDASAPDTSEQDAIFFDTLKQLQDKVKEIAAGGKQ